MLFPFLLALLAVSHAIQPHPRIILDSLRVQIILDFIANNSQAANYRQQLFEQGEYVLSVQPLQRPPANASDILGAARAVLQRVYITSLLYRLTGNDTYAERVKAELLNCTSWSDWDITKHALDTGELCHATAVGLDWTYDYLSRTENAAAKAAIIAGMVQKGMLPFRAAYNASASARPSWVNGPSNWVVVTNGGAGMAALSLLGEEGVPSWVQYEIVPMAMSGVLSSAGRVSVEDDGTGDGYATDGAWWEGPIYHGYASRYFVPYASAVETALGPEAAAPLWNLPGALSSASYQARIMSNGPSFTYFNWADAMEGQETLANLLSVSTRSGNAASAFILRARLDAHPTPINATDTAAAAMEYANALIYFTAAGSAADVQQQAMDAVYPRKKVAILRSSWSDSLGSFVGVKATNCSWNHGDLDSGQFVYSWGGVRWAADLGADNYALPDYFGGKRFDYYRKNSYGHNVLSFDGKLQDHADCSNTSTTHLVSFNSTDGVVAESPADRPIGGCPLPDGTDACVVLDLTAAYARPVGMSSVTRTMSLIDERTALLVSDRWTLGQGAARPGNVTWSMHTYVNVSLAGCSGGAVLRDDVTGSSVTVSVGPASPCPHDSVLWSVTPVQLHYPQYSTNGLSLLQAVLLDPASCPGLDMLIAPIGEDERDALHRVVGCANNGVSDGQEQHATAAVAQTPLAPRALPFSFTYKDFSLSNGVTLSCLVSGASLQTASGVALFLHGFPEGSWSWAGVMATGALNAYALVAPDLRGYNRSTIMPNVKDYDVSAVSNDVQLLIAEFGFLPIHLVAHDWGGAVAWWTAAAAPSLLTSLSIVNMAHPLGWISEVRTNKVQQECSSYVLDFVNPGFTTIATAGDFLLLKSIYGSEAFWAADEPAYESSWLVPGSVNAALNYYRANVVPLCPLNCTNASCWSAGVNSKFDSMPSGGLISSQLPVRVLWGMLDTAFDNLGQLEFISTMVKGRLNVTRYANNTHWLAQEQTLDVAAQLAEFWAMA